MDPDPTELFDRAAAALQARLREVTVGDLDAPTPCPGWTVRDLLAHLAEESCWAAGALTGEAPEVIATRCDGDLLGEQPVGSLDRLTAAARVATRDTSRETVSFGDSTMATADYLTELFADHLIHTWDLAVATGDDPVLDEELVAACASWFDAHERQWREAGEIAAPVPVDDDADPQTRLLARFGRNPAAPIHRTSNTGE